MTSSLKTVHVATLESIKVRHTITDDVPVGIQQTPTCLKVPKCQSRKFHLLKDSTLVITTSVLASNKP